jgi:hypothetical protein
LSLFVNRSCPRSSVAKNSKTKISPKAGRTTEKIAGCSRTTTSLQSESTSQDSAISLGERHFKRDSCWARQSESQDCVLKTSFVHPKCPVKDKPKSILQVQFCGLMINISNQDVKIVLFLPKIEIKKNLMSI